MIVAYHYWTHFDRLRKTSPVLKVSCRNVDIPLRYLCFFLSFNHSIPLFGLISTGSEKWALFWTFHAETLISCWDIYVFVNFDHSIPLFGLILTGSEKWALIWRFHAEMLISHWDIYDFVTFDCSIPLFGLILTRSKNKPCSEGFVQ